MHPLSTPKEVLTDAHNATIITYNGNENILQNDMGNAQIIDTKSGNVMGLNAGFVPLGVKEHGGVIYIASYNPKTKEGELGTIPSPRISYNLQDQSVKDIDTIIAGLNDSEDLIDYKITSDYIAIDDTTLFRVGDQFLVMLDMDHIKELYEKDLLTHFENSTETPGLYKISLYSKTVLGTYEKIEVSKPQWYFDNNGGLQVSNYWFVPASEDVDIDKTYKKEDLLIAYPNIPSGYLHIKIELEKPKNLDIIKNYTVNINCPIYYIL